jgi:hypothetical protein
MRKAGRGRKRSAAITLVLAGTLSGCGEPEAQRDVYRTLADCQRDWPGQQQCEQANRSGHSSTWFYGPRYYGSSFGSGAPRPSANAMSAFHDGHGGVARGGFGSSARSFSSSGG